MTSTSQRLFQWDLLAFFVSHNKALFFGVGKIKRMIRKIGIIARNINIKVGAGTLNPWAAAVWITVTKKDLVPN